MTVDQKIAALLAIRMRQDTIRSCINSHTTPAMLEHTAKWLEDLEGAFDAIYAIETVE